MFDLDLGRPILDKLSSKLCRYLSCDRPIRDKSHGDRLVLCSASNAQGLGVFNIRILLESSVIADIDAKFVQHHSNNFRFMRELQLGNSFTVDTFFCLGLGSNAHNISH
ncbi:hypothetical protein [[Leptolyngbya] sp. PCC 7376]|uniref:hypothetical protein n=1 Tax=[Leptolyngbya] sp. PCC 7376 TaxID=111781 RepID=UPI00135CE980|nr:hypothetical protein [[Leptolyngbya] sp. PCC 7376]